MNTNSSAQRIFRPVVGLKSPAKPVSPVSEATNNAGFAGAGHGASEISEPGHDGSTPAAKTVSAQPPALTLLQENRKEAYESNAVSPQTEAQMSSGVISANSSPDHCASDNFSQAAAMLPGKIAGAINGDPENSGGSQSLVLSHETPSACEAPWENTGPSFVVSTVVERLERNTQHETRSQLVSLPGILEETPEVKRLKEQKRRLEILQTFEQMTRSIAAGGLGLTKAEAARQIGEDYTSIWRYRKAFEEFGADGLLPDTENSGRSSMFEYLLLDEKFCAKLTELYLATIGSSGDNMVARAARTGRRTAKMATALTAMAEEPECPALLAMKLRQGKFPLCLQRFLKRITTDLENRLRGPKHFQLHGLVSRRDLTLRFPDGQRAEMPAGFKWVFDDMSANQPFWAQLGGEMLFSRQGLYALDHRSLRWLGKMLVARPREAYRAEDIIRFLRRLFEAYASGAATGGKPDVIVFERGVWHARKIRGFKLTETGALVEDEFVRPEMAVTERANLENGLSDLGIKVIFATSAHGKIIETCFNHLQDVLAIKARAFVNIGRHAGEYEINAKRLRQVRAGSHEPGNVGFATMNELAECVDAAFAHINGKLNSRKEVPDQVWERDLEARPLSPLNSTDAAALLPDVREKSLRGGCVTVQVNNQEWDFRADWMAQLGQGYRVFVKFDAHEPARGAAIYNREPHDSPNNRRVESAPSTLDPRPSGLYALGELIGFAAWEIPAPSVDVSGPVRGVDPRPLDEFYPGAVDQGDTIRRAQQKQVATHFSALPRPGQPAVKTVEASDGLGGVTRVDHASTLDPRPSTLQGPRPVRSALAPATAEQLEKQQNRVSRQAALAARLHAQSLAND